MQYELGFIGAGNMAEAIALGALRAGVLSADQMIAADPSPARCELFAQRGIAIAPDNAAALRSAKQVLLAVKPQTLPQIAALLGQLDTQRQVVISIMAGIGSAKIEQAAGAAVKVIRVMPNTPLLAGAGMAGIALGQHATDADSTLAQRLFAAGGKAVRVPETLIDAVTAVSGSGPAYVFYLAEAMAQAATQLGLGEHADTFVRQTILGAAKLLAESSDTPAELRRKVTSPGGTTAAAIGVMEARQVGDAVVAAIAAAQARSVELGRA